MAAYQRAIAGEIALFNSRVDLRHLHRLLRAVRQGHLLIHQPDNIGGQQRHLFRRQRHARLQLILLAEGDAVVHEPFELIFIATVVAQIAVAGKLGDLIAHQVLLVIAIAQTLLHQVLVIGERRLHVVAAKPLLLVGKARVGLHQVMALALGFYAKQAVIRQRHVWRHHADHRRYRLSVDGAGRQRQRKLLAGRQRQWSAAERGCLKRAQRYRRGARQPARIARAACRVGNAFILMALRLIAAALRAAVGLPDQRLHIDSLCDGRGAIVAAAFPLRGFGAAQLFLFLLRVPARLPADIRYYARAFGGQVIQYAGIHPQRAARHNLAVVVGQPIGVKLHIAAREDFARIALFNLRFLHGAGKGVLVKF
ncbi:Fibroin [Cronobacter dublinensis 1210]|uniref:Fibroin n=1 Tax=Cronobacter dublinensis 1210 TaxID=1208656 RepID=A0ABP1WDE0_9ENTR|nr:Fibroin [Cronobacter dublinensis 1210]